MQYNSAERVKGRQLISETVADISQYISLIVDRSGAEYEPLFRFS